MNRQDWQACEIEADKRMKASNGHSFVQILKVRCQYCRKSPKVKTRCGSWFHTYRDQLATVLIERGFLEGSHDLPR